MYKRQPKDCVIGEVGMGFINAMKTLSVGRVGVSSMCLGMAQEAIDLAVNHTKNRVQFGKPLAKMQALDVYKRQRPFRRCPPSSCPWSASGRSWRWMRPI